MNLTKSVCVLDKQLSSTVKLQIRKALYDHQNLPKIFYRPFYKSVWCKCITAMQKFAICLVILIPLVNFTNISRAAFTHADPKSAKRYWQLNWNFMLLGSVPIKDLRKKLVRIWYLVSPCKAHLAHPLLKSERFFLKLNKIFKQILIFGCIHFKGEIYLRSINFDHLPSLSCFRNKIESYKLKLCRLCIYRAQEKSTCRRGHP